MPDAFVIRRGGFSAKQQYCSGFKGDGHRARPRLEWSKDVADALRFARACDANVFITGLRIYNRQARVVQQTFQEVGSRS